MLARTARLTTEARSLQLELWLMEELGGPDVAALEECLSSGMLGIQTGTVAFRHEPARRSEHLGHVERVAGGDLVELVGVDVVRLGELRNSFRRQWREPDPCLRQP